MIQRLQSLYLLMAAIAVGLLFFFPLAELVNSAGVTYIFRYRGLYEQSKGLEIKSVLTIPLAFMFLANLLISFIAIFLYKKRTLQMKMCILNIILLICSLGLVYFYSAVSFSKFEATVHYQIFALMPIIAAILNFMAYKGIQKDEKLVKSVDRIR